MRLALCGTPEKKVSANTNCPESGRTTRCSAHLDRSDVIILCERASPDDHSIPWQVLLLPTDGNGTKGAKTGAAELYREQLHDGGPDATVLPPGLHWLTIMNGHGVH